MGYQALIMPGVNIGNGAIISSRSVVTSDVPAYSVVGGNPARVIKQRFNDETISTLEKLAWWDWSVEKITQHLPAIISADTKALPDD
jgi:virginiamycin A acetyltransferase